MANMDDGGSVPCCHWWLILPPGECQERDGLPARCKHCGAARIFPKRLQVQKEDPEMVTGRRKLEAERAQHAAFQNLPFRDWSQHGL